MATAAPEQGDLSGGESRVRNENDTDWAGEVRQLSDQELREKAQQLQIILTRTNLTRLFDGGEKVRLYLQAILDELNRRQQALARWPRAQARRAPARQRPSSDEAVWERVQRLQALFAGPGGCRRLRLFLETCFREVNNRGHAPVRNSEPTPMVDKVGCEICGVSIPRPTARCAKCSASAAPPISCSSGGAKRRRGPADEAATGSPEEPSNGEASERFEAELRQLSDQALWERAQRFQEALAASVSARLPDGGMRQCLYLEACLRELNGRRPRDDDAHP